MAWYLSSTDSLIGPDNVSPYHLDDFAQSLTCVDPRGPRALADIFRGLEIMDQISLIFKEVNQLRKSDLERGQSCAFLIMNRMQGLIKRLDTRDEMCLYHILNDMALLDADNDNIVENWMSRDASIRDRRAAGELGLSPTFWALDAGVNQLSRAYARDGSVSQFLLDREKEVLRYSNSKKVKSSDWITASLEKWGREFHYLHDVMDNYRM